jgi:protein arginine N-methyltransferase 7
MPGKPRGKGKAGMSSMDDVRKAAAQAKMTLHGERPPTAKEFEAIMAAQARNSNNHQTTYELSPSTPPEKDIKIHKGGAAKPTAKLAPHEKQNNKNSSTWGSGTAFVPPGADISSKSMKNAFMMQFEEHFLLPQRLRKVPTSLVEGVNDFHYAMMNDLPRNEFYYQMLKDHIVPGETTVLEIGAGSGLLSMMAASLGAKWVVAVEGSPEMARLAQRNIDANKFTDRVRVLNRMSTDLVVKDLPSQPDVLVSEIFGTLLLGESALEYLEDIRRRNIVRPDTKILPRFGKQYCCLIECPILDEITKVNKWKDIDLTLMNSLRDTASVVFTKKYGFRLNSMPYKRLTPPMEILSIDFEKTRLRDIPIEFSVSAKLVQPGKGHAFLYWWASWNREEDVKDLKVDFDKTFTFTGFDHVRYMSTDPDHTRESNNFARDMQWGQALQLVDAGMGPLPRDLIISESDVKKSKEKAAAFAAAANSSSGKGKDDDDDQDNGEMCFTCRVSEDRVICQMEIDCNEGQDFDDEEAFDEEDEEEDEE